MNKWILCALASALLQSCATMSPNECRSADWREVGYQDGLAGYPRSRIEDHEEACNKVGIGVTRDAYFAGRNQGVRSYCQPDNGIRMGRQGRGYSHVCPPDLEPGFLRGYEAGHWVYDARSQVERLDGERHELEKRLAKAGTDDDRRRLRDNLTDLDWRMRRARDELRWREDSLERAAREGLPPPR